MTATVSFGFILVIGGSTSNTKFNSQRVRTKRRRK